MKPTFLAVRAIGAEYARRLWWIVLIIVIVVSLIAAALLAWAVSESAWWLLLAIPVGVLISVAAVVIAVIGLLINYVRPEQSKSTKKKVKNFVGKLKFASEIVGTPKFILLFRIVRSIAAPSSEKFLENVVSTKDLKKDFQSIARDFEHHHTARVTR